MEYCADINGKFSCSEGALFECPHCEGRAFYWIGWYPYCSSGHDVRIPPKGFEEDMKEMEYL